MATILEKRELTPVTKMFVVDAPLVARAAQPGQFVIVRVDDHGERVPISLTDFDAEAGTITLVVQEVGKTSGLICQLEEGEELLDLAGPLGQPVSLPETGMRCSSAEASARARSIRWRESCAAAASASPRSSARAPPSC